MSGVVIRISREVDAAFLSKCKEGKVEGFSGRKKMGCFCWSLPLLEMEGFEDPEGWSSQALL